MRRDELEPPRTVRPKANVGGARNIARKLLKDSGIIEVPINLRTVVRYLKTRHDLEVWSFAFDKMDGMLVTVNGQPTIAFNPNTSWVRRRFTIAHEIGHLLMGHTCSSDNENAETEANKFAAELLMPLAFLKVDFPKDRDLDNLSARYIVSKEAITWHLMDCRLI